MNNIDFLKLNKYLTGEERINFFLTLGGQTSGQVIQIAIFFNDNWSVEEIG